MKKNSISNIALALNLTLASALLAGCGGGDPAPDQRPLANASEAQTTPSRQAPASASIAEVADHLMDVAEVRYSSYFLGHSATQASAPFSYRYYTQTGIFLGVVTGAGSAYAVNDVYVMGGSFGTSPVRVGQVSDFINLVDLSSGSSNGCDNPNEYSAGTHTYVARQYYGGTIAGAYTTDRQTGDIGAFQGNSAHEVVVTGTFSTSVNGVLSNRISRSSSYINATGEGESMNYGFTNVSTTVVPSTGRTSTVTATFNNTPPFVDRQYRLAIGQSIAQTQFSALSQTAVYGGPAAPRPSTTNTTSSTRTITTYLGRETITVPAGTYEACKFEVITPGSFFGDAGSYSFGLLNTRWVIVGTGLAVQDITSSPGAPTPPSVIKATSVMLNGQSL